MTSDKLAPVSGYLRGRLGPRGYQVLTVLLFTVGLGIVVAANYTLLASAGRGMTSKDFMSLWSGGKALTLGLNPYDETVWRPLRASYGDTWLPDAICPFPAWTILFFVPLSFLTTQMAGAVWMTLCEVALLAGVFLMAKALNWGDFRLYLPWILVGLVLYRPIFSAIGHGQLAPALFFLLAAATYLHRHGYPFAAGVLLALQVAKPNLTVFFVPLLGLIWLVRRDWRALSGLIAGGFGLLLASWIVLPGWIFQWLAVAEKGQIASITPTAWGPTHDLVGEAYWTTLAGAVVAAMVLGMVMVIWRQKDDDWLFSLGLALGVSAFATPYLRAYEQIVLFFPAMVGLYWGTTSGRWRPSAWIGAWLLVVVGLSWVLVFVAMSRGIDNWIAFVTLGVMGYFLIAWRAHRQSPLTEGNGS